MVGHRRKSRSNLVFCKEAFNLGHELWISCQWYRSILLLIFVFIFFIFSSIQCLHPIIKSPFKCVDLCAYIRIEIEMQSCKVN